MTTDEMWTDPNAVACNGPTLRDLAGTSLDLMLQPHRERLLALAASALTDPAAPALMARLAGIAHALSECTPWKDVQTGYADLIQVCVLCEEPRGVEHLEDCPYGMAVELMDAADERGDE